MQTGGCTKIKTNREASRKLNRNCNWWVFVYVKDKSDVIIIMQERMLKLIKNQIDACWITESLLSFISTDWETKCGVKSKESVTNRKTNYRKFKKNTLCWRTRTDNWMYTKYSGRNWKFHLTPYLKYQNIKRQNEWKKHIDWAWMALMIQENI